ncbi:MAG: hypothetical protein F4138_04800 [Acidimicrobiia bacterium]|nr:hypothetical protein [Acidimicrobiia bacterium]
MTTPFSQPAQVIAPDRVLRVAVLAKQIPAFENMMLNPDGRLLRDGVGMHINDYCRRAIAKGTEVARVSGGTVTVFTLGPPVAENVCREAILFGVDQTIHICDPAFAGSDTLATAKALARALEHFGPFDLVFMGRNSVDADTGQVPPQLAEMLKLPFAAGVRCFSLHGEQTELRLEHDDRWVDVTVQLPVVLSCAERLCEPCKIKDPRAWATVDASLIQTCKAAELGTGPWGQAASPTSVGAVHSLKVQRKRRMLSGTIEQQVAEAAAIFADLGVLDSSNAPNPGTVVHTTTLIHATSNTATDTITTTDTNSATDNAGVVVLAEPGKDRINKELLATAAELSCEVGGRVTAIGPGLDNPDLELGPWGADQQIAITASNGSMKIMSEKIMSEEITFEKIAAEDVAIAITKWISNTLPWAVLAPGTIWGREVASRIAATLNAGLTGDAVELRINDQGRLIAMKPAFGGSMLAEVLCSSPIQMVTVRPGVLPYRHPNLKRPEAKRSVLPSPAHSRMKIVATHTTDDSTELANASVVIGVGQGVDPKDYPKLEQHRRAIGATLCATRKVTDNGWMPRARQVGITGHSISPQLYLAIGTSGKFNHTVGVRNAGIVVGINSDPTAPLWDVVDIGIVGDWAEVLDALIPRLLSNRTTDNGTSAIISSPIN